MFIKPSTIFPSEKVNNRCFAREWQRVADMKRKGNEKDCEIQRARERERVQERKKEERMSLKDTQSE